MTNQHGHDDADKHEDFSDTPIIPSPDNPDPDGLFIAEVQGRNKRLRQLIQFTHSSTKAAAIMAPCRHRRARRRQHAGAWPLPRVLAYAGLHRHRRLPW